MRIVIVRLANYAHTFENPFKRRSLLALAVFALVLYEIGKWIGIILFVPIYPWICAIIGFYKGIDELWPYSTSQAERDFEIWQSDAAGIRRIWGDFKPGDEKMITNLTGFKGDPNDCYARALPLLFIAIAVLICGYFEWYFGNPELRWLVGLFS